MLSEGTTGAEEPYMRIADRRIGAGEAPFIIAELSGNHGGSLQRALATVDAIAAAGADALKLQTYTAETMTLDIDRSEFTSGPPRDSLGGPDVLRPVRRGAHALGMARTALQAGARARPDRVQQSL